MPIPVIDVCLAEGILSVKDAGFRNEEVSGMIHRTDRGHITYVKKTEPAVRQRFTGAHELGHYLLHIQGPGR